MFKKILAALMAFVAFSVFASVDVNKANAAALDGVNGIGPGIAGKILDARKKGRFKDWDDLIARVQGIGEAKAASLSEAGLTVNGQTFKGVAAAPAKKDAKAEPKADPKAPPKADAKADPKTDPKAAPKADAKADAKAAPKAEVKADTKPDAKAAKPDEKKKDAQK
jgi:competence protein ComEA